MEYNYFYQPLNYATSHWLFAFFAWLATWAVLVYLSPMSRAIVYVGVGLLAVKVSHLIVNAIANAKPKKIIENVQGKAVLITGCDSGFGYLLSLRLDALGFKVFAGCFMPEGEGAMALKKQASTRLRVLHLDVTDDEVVDKAESIVRKELEVDNERLWALVNNAGVAAMTEIEWCPLEVYKKMFEVNTLGVIRMTKKFLPILRLGEEGSRVVIVTSLAGRYSLPGFSAYSMSKFACCSFADALRIEMMKWNVTVHTVEPTLYSTNICRESALLSALDKNWQDCPEQIKKSYGQAYLDDFKIGVHKHLSRAKPADRVKEVVDDLLDAVAGTKPKCRYVPSLETQFRCHILSSLPTNALDYLLVKGTPQTPPADIEVMKKPQNKFVF